MPLVFEMLTPSTTYTILRWYRDRQPALCVMMAHTTPAVSPTWPWSMPPGHLYCHVLQSPQMAWSASLLTTHTFPETSISDSTSFDTLTTAYIAEPSLTKLLTGWNLLMPSGCCQQTTDRSVTVTLFVAASILPLSLPLTCLTILSFYLTFNLINSNRLTCTTDL